MTAAPVETAPIPLPQQPEFDGILIGPDEPVYLHPSALNEVAQVRQSYDAERIEELARSMVKGDMPEGLELSALSEGELAAKLVLIHPLSVARFSTLEIAQEYLDAHARHYGLDIPRAAESLELNEDGYYYLLIAGHRRKRAIKLLQDKFEIPDDRLKIATNVYDDIGFDEALGLQLRENVHERPPIDEEARAIERYYKYLTERLGQPPTIPRLAGELGIGESKIRTALAFAEMPDDVQNLMKSGLSYTMVSQLRPIYDAYLERYDKAVAAGFPPEEEREKYASNEVGIVAQKILENNLDRSPVKARALIEGQLSQARREVTYDQDSLLDIGDATSSRKRRHASAKRLGAKAVTIVDFLEKGGYLSPDDRERIVALAGRITASEIENDPIPGLTLAIEA